MKEEKSKETIRVSVRELVEGLKRSGDLSVAFTGSSRAVEGIRAHQALQRARTGDYCSEVPVSLPVEFDRFILEIQGRIDGVFLSGDDVLIEEIKTTRRSREALEGVDNPLHWGQLKIYAFVYAEKEGLPEIDAQLTYYLLHTGELREFRRRFKRDELETFFHEIVAGYIGQIQSLAAWRESRDASIHQLEFPYPAYRPGQREMAVEIYRAIRDRGQLMVQAATGIGKTMAALFPAVKAVADGPWSKVFYLTARTTGRAAAEKALEELRDKGLKLKSVTLTAKEKICFKEKLSCLPEDCEYARGYYDRIDGALKVFFRQDAFSRRDVEELAGRHRVCPFELSLDLSLNADVIICDYNYAFDPRVYLQRFFMDDRGDYIFLVDEAHNLVHRARDMFSSDIRKQAFLDRRRPLKEELPDIYKCMGKINAALVKERKRCEAARGPLSDKEAPKTLYPLLKDFVKTADRWLTKNEKTSYREGLLDLYFSVRGFLKIAEFYDVHYVTCYEKIGKDLRVKLFCMDSSANLDKALERCGAAVFFSGTMSPAGYFRKVLGCSDSVKSLELGSPFPRENLCPLIADGISTLYRLRDRTKQQVVLMISSIVSHRKGNYLLFFPSYEYMCMVHEVFVSENPGTGTLLQRAGMTEAERDGFLAQFSRENPETLVGFAVMGGIFGEGIDLVGDRLTGAVIVGVGLPGISPENELIRDHFEKNGRSGFDYAYLYPGINRVLQAAGRVIRTETDRGVVLLIDERYSFGPYGSLLPREWQPVRFRSARQLETVLRKFWDGCRSAEE